MALFKIEWTFSKGIIGTLTALFALGAAFFGLMNGYDQFCHFSSRTWIGSIVCRPVKGAHIMAIHNDHADHRRDKSNNH